MTAFQSAKMVVVEHLGLSKDACHIYVGLGVFVLTLVILRKRRSSLIPWLLVFLAAASGEALDRYDDLNTIGYWRWQESAHDLLNTLFWPTVLVVLLRLGLLGKTTRR